MEHITREGLLQHDEKRAEDYKVAKTIIDNYHIDFIETVLSQASFDWKDLMMQKNSKTFKRNIVDKFKNISAKMNGIKCLWHQL